MGGADGPGSGSEGEEEKDGFHVEESEESLGVGGAHGEIALRDSGLYPAPGFVPFKGCVGKRKTPDFSGVLQQQTKKTSLSSSLSNFKLVGINYPLSDEMQGGIANSV